MLADWFPALTTTALFAGALWLGRQFITTRLKASVQSEFDTKLENLRAEQRRAEEVLRAQLRASESQIAALQSGTLGAIQSRRQAMDARRLVAVDQLMEAMIELGKARMSVQFMQVVKFREAAEETAKDAKARELFKGLSTADLKTLNVTVAQKARPFVTPPLWAAYQAYLSTCLTAVLKLNSLATGTGKFIKNDDGRMQKMILGVLPHYKDFIEEHGEDAAFFLVEDLEAKVLSEMQAMLRGEEGDVEQLKRAAEVIKLAGELRAEQQTTATKV